MLVLVASSIHTFSNLSVRGIQVLYDTDCIRETAPLVDRDVSQVHRDHQKRAVFSRSHTILRIHGDARHPKCVEILLEGEDVLDVKLRAEHTVEVVDK